MLEYDIVHSGEASVVPLDISLVDVMLVVSVASGSKRLLDRLTVLGFGSNSN